MDKKTETGIRIVDTEEAALLTGLRTISHAMLEKKAQGVISLDFRKLTTSTICDCFVICNADSTTQVNAICDNVEEQMYACCDRGPLRVQGRENAFWVILDYGDIVVHVFQTEQREFYRLEDLWADAVKVEYKDED